MSVFFKPEKIKKVLLTNPFSYEKKRNLNIGVDPVVFRHVGQEIKTGLTFPIGLAYMAAVILRKGYQVEMFDPNAQNVSVQEIHNAALSSDLIFMPFSPIYSRDILKFKNLFKNKIFILGGGYARFIASKLIRENYCDIVFNSEGDSIIGEFADKYPEIDSVSGITFRKKAKIISSGPANLTQNLDQLPFPDRKLLNPKKYWEISFFGSPAAWVLPSRGCWYDCIFCAKIAKQCRFRSHENVVEEIQSVIDDFGIKNFVFFDENFNLNNKFIISFCKEILSRKINIYWNCTARADLIEKDAALLMKQAGCVEVRIGLESANDHILKYLQKGTTVNRIKKGLQILNEVGLSYSLQCIFGSYLENNQTISNTMNFVKKAKPLFVSYNILTPLPGSDLFKKLGGEFSLEQVKKFDIIHTEYPLGRYSGDQLRKILKKAYFSYYLNFSYLVRICREVLKRFQISFIYGVFKVSIKQAVYLFQIK